MPSWRHRSRWMRLGRVAVLVLGLVYALSLLLTLAVPGFRADHVRPVLCAGAIITASTAGSRFATSIGRHRLAILTILCAYVVFALGQLDLAGTPVTERTLMAAVAVAAGVAYVVVSYTIGDEMQDDAALAVIEQRREHRAIQRRAG